MNAVKIRGLENFISIGASGLYTVRLKEVKGKPSISALTQAYARVSIRLKVF